MTDDLLNAAKALLERIDNMTTDEFSMGGERTEREALRLAIAQAEFPVGLKLRKKAGPAEAVYAVRRVYLRDADVYVAGYWQRTPDQAIGVDLPASAFVRA